MKHRMLGALTGLAALVAAPAMAQNAVAIKGGKVVTMAGEPIVGGVVLIRDGKIAAVGKDLTIPTEYRVIDATDKVVMPGFIDVHSPRGVEQSSERNANTPFLSIVDALDPALEYFEECRRNGVTTIAAVPGDDTMIGSQAAVIKTAGTYIDQMVLKRRFAIKISLKPTPDRSRMSQLAALRREFDAAKTFLEEESERKTEGAKKGEEKKESPKAEEKKEEKKDEKSDATKAAPPASAVATPQIDALVRVLKGELKVYIYCETAMDVPQALKLIDQYRLKAILCLGPNCYKAAQTAARSGWPIVLDPTLVFWETDPRTGEDKQIALPKLYKDAGATFAFQTTGFQGGSLFRQASLPPTVGTNYLWFQAATAVKHGLPEAEALQAMTVVPAKWLGVDGFVGTIEPGKDGDVVVLSGDPLKLATWVDTTLVNGQVVYERSKDKKLEQLLQPKGMSMMVSRDPKGSASALTIATALLACSASFAADVVAYRVGRLWDGKNAAVADAVIVVKDGKIAAVGPGKTTPIPSGAKTVDLSSAVVIPGLVAAETNLTEAGRDDVRTIRPDVRAVDGVDDYADHAKWLAGGITTVQASPGARRLVTGQGTVFKLAGEPGKRSLREVESLRVLLTNASRNPPTVYEPPVGAVSVDRPLEPTKKQPGTTLPGAVSALRGLFRASKNPGKDPLAAATAPFLKQDAVVRIAADNAAEIRAALQLAESEKFNLLLVEPKNLETFASSFSRWKPRVKGVLLSAGARPGTIANPAVPERGEPRSKPTWEYAKALSAQVPVAVTPTSDADGPELLYQAGLFLRGGWSELEALKSVTLAAAEILGVANRVGSLEVGKDADFVVLSNDPFAVSTSVRSAYVGGKRVFDRKESDATTRISASGVWTGSRYIKDGSVLVQGKTIRSVGENSAVGEGGQGMRFPEGAVIAPGFIDLGSGLGLDGPASGISMSTKFAGKLHGADRSFAEARRGGVTTTLLWPGGDSFAVVAFKLNDLARIVKEPAAIGFNGEGPLAATGERLRNALKSGKDYHESFIKYDAAMVEYEKAKKDYDAAKAKEDAAKKPEEKKAEPKKEEKKEAPAEKKEPPKTLARDDDEEDAQAGDPAKKEGETKKEEKKAETKSALPPEPKAPTKPTVNDAQEPYRLLFTGKIPAMVEARRLANIEQAAKIFRDEFKVRTVLVDADDAFRRTEKLQNRDLAFALTPAFVREVDYETINLPQSLALHSLPIGFQSRATTGVRELPDAVRYAVRKGLGSEDALVGLTSGPAKFLGLDSLGVLEPGKDADLVVFSGPPIALSSKVLAIMIDGKWVFKAEEDR